MHEPVGVIVDAGQPKIEVAGDGSADGAREVQRIVSAVFQMQIGGELVGRLVRAEQDTPSPLVLRPYKVPCRSLQHLDLVQVEDREGLRGRRADVDIVDIDTVRPGVVRVEVVQADAANGDDRLVARAGVVDDLHIGRDLLQVLRLLDAKGLDLLRGDGLHGHWHVLDVLGSPLGGDRDRRNFISRSRRRGRLSIRLAARLRSPRALAPAAPTISQVRNDLGDAYACISLSPNCWLAARRGAAISLSEAHDELVFTISIEPMSQ